MKVRNNVQKELMEIRSVRSAKQHETKEKNINTKITSTENYTQPPTTNKQKGKEGPATTHTTRSHLTKTNL